MSDITTASFDAALFQSEVAGFIVNELVAGAPFTNRLTPLVTDRNGVVIGRAAPTGFGWVAEGQTLPTVDLGDSSDVIAVKKLAGIFDLSNESLSDTTMPVADMLGQVVRDSMAHDLDAGLLYGAGGLEPTGVVARAEDAVAGVSLRQGVVNAWAELVDAGAPADRVVAFGSAATLAEELGRETDEGRPVHPDGMVPVLGPGVPLVAVPALEPGIVLVVDTSHVFAIVRADFAVELDPSAGFRNDTTACRVKGRFAVAAPAPDKSLRVARWSVPS
jgi:HK97 family phage major capsid protein